jgi:hypothetical protein
MGTKMITNFKIVLNAWSSITLFKRHSQSIIKHRFIKHVYFLNNVSESIIYKTEISFAQFGKILYHFYSVLKNEPEH